MLHRDLTTLFQKAFDGRAGLFPDPATDCFRLFNGAGDGMEGIFVDRYGAYLLVLVEKPALLDAAESLCAASIKAAAKLPVQISGVLLKDITGADTGCIDDVYASRVMEGEAPPAELVVTQNGVRVSVDLMAGRHTGLFLDMRCVRDRLVPCYNGTAAMLNLFCYSGVFSVHALKNGAGQALNIDLAKTALARVRRNYLLNGLACNDRDLMYGDALQWMRAFVKKGRRFDFVVLDPPTFARSKGVPFSMKRDFPRCLELVQALAPQGRALTVVNSPAVSERQYRDWHPKGWRMVFLEHESQDFPPAGRPYLKAGLWQVSG